jgi:hypothetical protein
MEESDVGAKSQFGIGGDTSTWRPLQVKQSFENTGYDSSAQRWMASRDGHTASARIHDHHQAGSANKQKIFAFLTYGESRRYSRGYGYSKTDDVSNHPPCHALQGNSCLVVACDAWSC